MCLELNVIYFRIIYWTFFETYKEDQKITRQIWSQIWPELSYSLYFRSHWKLSYIWKHYSGTSLVAQWLRIRLPMQGTRTRALVREDPTCCRATKPVCHNYWACALEITSHSYWARASYSPCSATREATAIRSLRTTTKSSSCSPHLEKARAQQWRPNTAKNK